MSQAGRFWGWDGSAGIPWRSAGRTPACGEHPEHPPCSPASAVPASLLLTATGRLWDGGVSPALLPAPGHQEGSLGLRQGWQGSGRGQAGSKSQHRNPPTAEGLGTALGCSWHGSASDALAGALSVWQPPGSSGSFSLFQRCTPGADTAPCPSLSRCQDRAAAKTKPVVCQGQDFPERLGWSWDSDPRGDLPVLLEPRRPAPRRLLLPESLPEQLMPRKCAGSSEHGFITQPCVPPLAFLPLGIALLPA